MDGLAGRIAHLAIDGMVQAGLPVFGKGRLLGVRGQGADTWECLLALPYAPDLAKPCFEALAWATRCVWTLIDRGCSPETQGLVLAQQAALIKELGTKRQKGTNTLRFLGAAHEAGIPWNPVANLYHQYGWGARQVWANSSILDTTSGLAVTLARNKQACALVLRRAGLPVPDHGLAKNLEEARGIAERLGYPVVIKPVNLDGGVGVAAGLQNVEQLEQAWAKTILHSNSILVEKHQPGEDYRLIVFNGRLVWAVGRQPAGVTGDGGLSIAELVARANLDPRRGYHATATLRPLSLDEEALDLLAEDGYSAATVLPAGQFARLRRASNLSSGGLPVVVTDQVHPDNRSLVERAASLLRLDLAGVDLIVPDITVSWRNSGGGIIEVNAQPQLVAASQSHLYRTILEARVTGRGRIPVVAFVGRDALAIAEGVLQGLGDLRPVTGLASRKGLWLGEEFVGRAGLSPFAAGRGMLLQRETEALLIVVDDDSLLRTGLPCDAYDALVVAHPHEGPEANVAWLPRSLEMILDNCVGDVVLSNQGLAHALQKMGVRFPKTLRVMPNAEEMMGLVARQVADLAAALTKRNG
ncbi:MAG: cyanophycin synthetase [Rhodocyclaceae bacterium]|nr:cyanophycin synthetase [Rhodocyclaceae bacterium]